MARQQAVSWRFPYEARQFGRFVGYLPDNMVRVRRGMRKLDIPQRMLTIEIG